MPEALSPEIELALGYARPDMGERLQTLLRFDRRLGAGIAVTKEPQLAQIRLAWWRDEIARAADLTASAVDPDLDAVLDMVRRRDVTTEPLCRVIEGWSHCLEPLPLSAGALSNFAGGRGGGLVTAAAALAGVSAPEQAGEAWALVDFARHCSDAATRGRALAMAEALPSEAIPSELRPFALLDAWAQRDARRLLAGQPPLSLRARAFSALIFSITGPRL